jgi:hypothetical protein
MPNDRKFKFGDIPTNTLELSWTIREADLARYADDDPARALYWPPRPPMPPGQEFTAPTELLVLLTLLLFVGEPKDGKFTCHPKVATIARITGLDSSTVRKYLKCLRERGVIKWGPWGKARLFEFNIKRLAAAAGKATADYGQAKTKRSEDDQAEEERLNKLWDMDNLDDQAAVADLGGPDSTFTTGDAEDIVATNARRDAECKAATGGDCLTIGAADTAKPDAVPAAGGDEDDWDWRTDTEYLAIQTDYTRGIYDCLGRSDVPQDLMPALEVMVPLLERLDDGEWNRVMNHALNDKWWFERMKKSAKKYESCPIGYFVNNYDAIKAQADEAATKAAKKAGAKKATQSPTFDEKRWQKDYAEAEAGHQSACENRDNSAYDHWDARRVELEAEKATATGSL